MGDEESGHDFLSPHVLMFPLPLQGPVKCMLKLAEILCLNDIKVTFLNTHRTHQRLLKSQTYMKRYPNFRWDTVPDGPPGEIPPAAHHFSKMMESLEAAAVPAFREIVTSGGCSRRSENPVSCIIADGIYSFASGVAAEIGVPCLYLETVSPSCVWIYFCLPQLIQAGELPFKDDNLEAIVMSEIIRRRDLPSFCRGSDVLTNPDLHLVLSEVTQIPLSHGLILNTFHHLDAPVLSQIRHVCPTTYAVGPLHAHLKARLATPQSQSQTASTTFWEEDTTCISWLDRQPPKSVVYVSIGSLAVMTEDQMFEIWYGLVNSGSRFLWARRPDSAVGLDSGPALVPSELSEGTRERGRVVSWAPQEEVMAHHAVGAFFTHCGWNSTLESIVEGKPMICWPSHADQQVNSRFVGHVWRLGLDMKDKCDRVTIEKMIREVMDVRKDEFLKRSEEMAILAKCSVSEGGTSFEDLDHLIQDIKKMKIK